LEDERIVVIGAGIGGLSAAIHLAAAGRPVTVLEQNTDVGGKMGLWQADGFTWDTGPSIITMRPALAALFATAGRRLEDYLTLLPVDPLTRYFYPDGTVIDAAQNLPRMLEQITALDPHDAEGYLAFLAHAAELHRITGDIFIYGEPPTLRDFLRVPLRDIVRVDAWRAMAQAHAHYVRSAHLRQLLGRFATYVGASPYQASAVLNAIAHVELNQGVWYPQGGIYQIARAYRRLAEELGVEIHTESRVTRIDVQNGAVCGVTLANGERLPAQAIVANVDVTTVYHDLLPPDVAPARRRRLTRLASSGSGFVLLLGIEGQHPALAQHNIFFARDYRREFDDLFTRGVPPQEATIYVTATSKVDPQHAPPGCENWFVMVNAPPLGPGFDWATQGQAYRDALLTQLAAHGYDVRGRIRSERWRTPEDLRTQTSAWRGALYGLSSNNPLNALRRPHNRCPDTRGLYFAGGTTHPGGGVPMVTLSGGVAARMILESNHK